MISLDLDGSGLKETCTFLKLDGTWYVTKLGIIGLTRERAREREGEWEREGMSFSGGGEGKDENMIIMVFDVFLGS